MHLRVCAMRCRPECATGPENCVRACVHMADASGPRDFDETIRLACGSSGVLAQPEPAAGAPAARAQLADAPDSDLPRRRAQAGTVTRTGGLPLALVVAAALCGGCLFARTFLGGYRPARPGRKVARPGGRGPRGAQDRTLRYDAETQR